MQAAEASTAAPGAAFTVTSPAGTVLGAADARTLLAEAATYVVLSGGLAPTLTAPDGTALSFVNASALLGFALGMAQRAGTATPAALATYGLTLSWLAEIGQADLQAAARLQAMAKADTASGNTVQAYAEGVGASLATKIQQTAPAQRQALSITSMVGQWQVSVSVSGDPDDPAGLAGYACTVTDTDPARTALIAQAQAAVADAAAAAAAGNALLAFLDQAQARVDVAYAALPPGARSDKMLGVAQQFVFAAQAAAAGDWNLVQTLETAADVSLQIAAQPEGSRHAMTERFMHKAVKHDITVDPNDADPFAHFSDHSKGEDVIGSIVEAVVGVVINILAASFASATVHKVAKREPPCPAPPNLLRRHQAQRTRPRRLPCPSSPTPPAQWASWA